MVLRLGCLPTGPNAKDSEVAEELAGEFVARALCSKNWQLRDAAVIWIAKQVRSPDTHSHARPHANRWLFPCPHSARCRHGRVSGFACGPRWHMNGRAVKLLIMSWCGCALPTSTVVRCWALAGARRRL